MKKKYLFLLFVVGFLLGFFIRGGFFAPPVDNIISSQISDSKTELLVELEANKSKKLEKVQLHEDSVNQIKNNLVTVPYDSSDPFTRLNALEKATYSVPGYAIAKLIPRVLDHREGISSEMKFVMQLNAEEEDKFDQLLNEATKKIREIEAEFVKDRVEFKTEDEFVYIPAFAGRGEKIRTDLFDQIEGEMGYERRQIFEMIMLNQSAAFGNYGQTNLVLRNPKVEMVNGRHEMVAVELGILADLGTADERFEGTERVFSRTAFEKRFGHIYELNEE